MTVSCPSIIGFLIALRSIRNDSFIWENKGGSGGFAARTSLSVKQLIVILNEVRDLNRILLFRMK